jgi:hypothetical protein
MRVSPKEDIKEVNIKEHSMVMRRTKIRTRTKMMIKSYKDSIDRGTEPKIKRILLILQEKIEKEEGIHTRRVSICSKKNMTQSMKKTLRHLECKAQIFL